MLLGVGLPLALLAWIGGLWMLRRVFGMSDQVRLGDIFVLQLMIDSFGLVLAMAATIDDSPAVAWSVFAVAIAVGPSVATRVCISPRAVPESVAAVR